MTDPNKETPTNQAASEGKECSETYWRRKYYQRLLFEVRFPELVRWANKDHPKRALEVSRALLEQSALNDVWTQLKKDCEGEKRDYDWLINTWGGVYMIAFLEEDFGKAKDLEIDFYKFWGCPITKHTENPKEFIQW